MRWCLAPATAALLVLGAACSDSTAKTDKADPGQGNTKKPVLTYFNIPT